MITEVWLSYHNSRICVFDANLHCSLVRWSLIPWSNLIFEIAAYGLLERMDNLRWSEW